MRFSRRTFSLATIATPLLGTTLGHAQSATPASTGFEPASDRLAGLLQYVPGGILDDDLYVVWNDFERQVAAIRASNPEATDTQSDDELVMMSLWSNGPDFIMWAMELEELTGYNIASVQQTLQTGQPPNISLIVELDSEVEVLIPFWESAGYEHRENEVGEFWTIGEEAEMDFQNPIQQKLMSRMNNVAIIGGNLLAYSPYSSLLQQIMSAAEGEIPNRVAELEPTFAGLPEDAVSAWMIDGHIFEFGGLFVQQALSEQLTRRVEDMIAESNDAVGQMPAIRTICVGNTAGPSRDEEIHNPGSREFIILETDGADMAEQAAAVIEWRHANLRSLQTGESHTNLLPSLEFEILEDELLRVSTPLEAPVTILTRMIQSGDTVLFTYQ